MKKILIMILLVSLTVTGCGATNKDDLDNDTNNDTDVPETIIDDPVVDTDANPNNESVLVRGNENEVEAGKEAPNFTLVNLDGEEVSLSDYRGNIVLINFWASWCQWCDIEMPDINKLENENEDVIILAVNVMEDEFTVREYIEENQLDFEVVLDVEGEIALKYLVTGLPHSYFVDKEGIIQLSFPGAMDYEQMIGYVDAIRDFD